MWGVPCEAGTGLSWAGRLILLCRCCDYSFCDQNSLFIENMPIKYGVMLYLPVIYTSVKVLHSCWTPQQWPWFCPQYSEWRLHRQSSGFPHWKGQARCRDQVHLLCQDIIIKRIKWGKETILWGQNKENAMPRPCLQCRWSHCSWRTPPRFQPRSRCGWSRSTGTPPRCLRGRGNQCVKELILILHRILTVCIYKVLNWISEKVDLVLHTPLSRPSQKPRQWSEAEPMLSLNIGVTNRFGFDSLRHILTCWWQIKRSCADKKKFCANLKKSPLT